MAFFTHVREAVMDFLFNAEGSLPMINLCAFLHRDTGNDFNYVGPGDQNFLSRMQVSH